MDYNHEGLEAIRERKPVNRNGLHTQGQHRRIRSKQLQSGLNNLDEYNKPSLAKATQYKKFVDRNFMILIGGGPKSQFDKSLRKA